MALHLPIQYEQVVALVEQLSDEQQRDLLTRLQHHTPLTIEAKLRLLDALVIHNTIREEPSVRREDWYGDDGR